MQNDDQMGSFSPYVDTSGYSPEKFYTRSRDSHGHDKSLRHGSQAKDVIQVPPELHAMFYELKSQWPDYKTNADIMRDALVHLAHMRAEQLKHPTMGILKALQKLHALVELEKLEADVAADRGFMARVDVLFKEARTDRKRAMLEDVIREYLVTCEDEEIRGELEQLLKRL